MSNSSNPTVVGITKDVVGLAGKLVKLSFKGIGWTARKANNVVDFAVDATKEGFVEPSDNPKPTQLEFEFRGADDNEQNK